MAYMNLSNYNIYNNILDMELIYDDIDVKDTKNKCVEIDESFAYIIQQLNIKGYKTKFCCSGHFGSDKIEENNDTFDKCGGYIYFKKKHIFEYIPACLYISGYQILRFDFTSPPNTYERFIELNNIMLDIADWVNKLEYIT